MIHGRPKHVHLIFTFFWLDADIAENKFNMAKGEEEREVDSNHWQAKMYNCLQENKN